MQYVRRRPNWKSAAIVTGLSIFLLAIVFFGVAFHFRGRFLPGTYVNGISVSGKTVSQVEYSISSSIAPYELLLIDDFGEDVCILGSSIDLSANFQDSLSQILEQSNCFHWFFSLFSKTEYTIDQLITYDEEALASLIYNCSFVTDSTRTHATSASISEYEAGVGYSIIPETDGTAVDTECLLAALDEAIKSLATELSLAESGCYEVASLCSDNALLMETVNTLNTCVATSITFTFGTTSESLSGTTISDWLSVEEDFTVLLNEEAVADFVAALADAHDTYGKARSFTTTSGAVVTLSLNRYGWKIDQESETAAIIEEIWAGATVSRTPAYSSTAASYSSQDYGTTYVEVNLTAQLLYLYKNGELILTTEIVSGLLPNCATPTGAFSVTYKTTNATLRGSTYAEEVSYWMPYYGNYGMHDATWRDDFGGNYYEENGSHGCVNLPLESAAIIYETIKAGTAVFVYELDGTETEKYWDMTAADAVSALIAALDDTITESSATAVSNARSAYDALSASAKTYVTSYDRLVAAEETLSNLNAEENPLSQEN